MPVTSAPSEPEPLGIELTDGSRWRVRVGGSWGGRADDYAGAYSCESGNTCRTDPGPQHFIAVLTRGDAPAVKRDHQPWTVLIGELGDPSHHYPAPKSRAVSKAYFIVNSIRT